MFGSNQNYPNCSFQFLRQNQSTNDDGLRKRKGKDHKDEEDDRQETAKVLNR